MNIAMEIQAGQTESTRTALVNAITNVADAMKADYGERFKRAYPTEQEQRMLKRRLWMKLKAFFPQAIVEGYDALVSEKPEYLPGVNEIYASVRRTHKLIERRNEEIRHSVRVSKLPPLKRRYVDVSEVLSDFHSKQQETKKRTKEEMEVEIQKHESMILAEKAKGHIKPPRMPAQPECAAVGCLRPGTMSRSTRNDNGFWYCSEHVDSRGIQ